MASKKNGHKTQKAGTKKSIIHTKSIKNIYIIVFAFVFASVGALFIYKSNAANFTTTFVKSGKFPTSSKGSEYWQQYSLHIKYPGTVSAEFQFSKIDNAKLYLNRVDCSVPDCFQQINSLTGSSPLTLSNAVEPGIYHIGIRGIPRGGNSYNLKVSYPATDDYVAPTVKVNSPVFGSVVSGKSVPVSGTASDPSGMKSVVIHIKKPTETTNLLTLPATADLNNWSSVLDSTALPNGTYSVSLVATDNVGNTVHVGHSFEIVN